MFMLMTSPICTGIWLTFAVYCHDLDIIAKVNDDVMMFLHVVLAPKKNKVNIIFQVKPLTSACMYTKTSEN